MTAPDHPAATSPSASFHSYGDYIRLLIRPAVALTALERQARDLGQVDDAQRLRDTLHRLEEGAFSIAVVGEFMRGKTTVINALLGSSTLPMDVLPATAAITRVVHGHHPEATLVWRDGSSKHVPVEALASYVTKSDEVARARAASIHEAIVAYPTLFWQNNVEIIDTPGLSDKRMMTEIAVQIIPKVDTAVMVISALAPFSQTEASLLGLLLQHIEPGLAESTAKDREALREISGQFLGQSKEWLCGFVTRFCSEVSTQGQAVDAELLDRHLPFFIGDFLRQAVAACVETQMSQLAAFLADRPGAGLEPLTALADPAWLSCVASQASFSELRWDPMDLVELVAERFLIGASLLADTCGKLSGGTGEVKAALQRLQSRQPEIYAALGELLERAYDRLRCEFEARIETQRTAKAEAIGESARQVQALLATATSARGASERRPWPLFPTRWAVSSKTWCCCGRNWP